MRQQVTLNPPEGAVETNGVLHYNSVALLQSCIVRIFLTVLSLSILPFNCGNRDV